MVFRKITISKELRERVINKVKEQVELVFNILEQYPNLTLKEFLDTSKAKGLNPYNARRYLFILKDKGVVSILRDKIVINEK